MDVFGPVGESLNEIVSEEVMSECSRDLSELFSL